MLYSLLCNDNFANRNRNLNCIFPVIVMSNRASQRLADKPPPLSLQAQEKLLRPYPILLNPEILAHQPPRKLENRHQVNSARPRQIIYL